MSFPISFLACDLEEPFCSTTENDDVSLFNLQNTRSNTNQSYSQSQCSAQESEFLKKVANEKQNQNLQNCSEIGKQLDQSKRIQKRQEAKLRTLQTKGDLNLSELSSGKETLSKEKQKLRNRISAQNSRDRKKAYIECLEKENSELKYSLKSMEQQNYDLLQQNHVLSNEIASLQFQNQNACCPLCGISINNQIEYNASQQHESFQETNLNQNNQNGNFTLFTTTPFLIFCFIACIGICLLISTPMQLENNQTRRALTQTQDFLTQNNSKKSTALMEIPNKETINNLPILKYQNQSTQVYLNLTKYNKSNFLNDLNSNLLKILQSEWQLKGQLVPLGSNQTQNLPTFFCPTCYQFADPDEELNSNLDFENWVQILIANEQMGRFHVTDAGEIILQKPSISEKGKKLSGFDNQNREHQFVQLVCQVSQFF